MYLCDIGDLLIFIIGFLLYVFGVSLRVWICVIGGKGAWVNVYIGFCFDVCVYDV